MTSRPQKSNVLSPRGCPVDLCRFAANLVHSFEYRVHIKFGNARINGQVENAFCQPKLTEA